MGAATALVAQRDANRWVLDDFINQSGYIGAIVFAGAAARTLTAPAGAKFVVITSNISVYVKIGGSAAVPVADVTDGSASQIVHPNAALRLSLDGTATVGFAAAGAGIVTAVFYL